jgi:hypothetical protein
VYQVKEQEVVRPLETAQDMANMAKAVQAEKCVAKETGRAQILTSRLPFTGAETNLVAAGFLEKSKQLAVSKMMKGAKAKGPLPMADKRKKPATVTPKPKSKKGTSKHKGGTTAPEKEKEISDEMVVKLRTASIHLCGCRHGDLRAFKSFTNAERAYYSRPNKFLENRICLDCKRAVRDMTPSSARQKAVVFYCDEGVKGFSAPDEDPMKEELTCNLVLCPQCEGKRRQRFEKGETGQEENGRKRLRRQAEV